MQTGAIRPGAEWDHLVRTIVRAAVTVHCSLGPGFLEAIYQKGLIVELKACGYHCSSEVEVPVSYRGVHLGKHRLDLVVAGRAVLELKAVSKLDASHFAQVRSYLAASGHPVGLLINFAGPRVECRRVFSANDRKLFPGLRGRRVSAPAEAEVSGVSGPAGQLLLPGSPPPG
jgi:GxxExxY protein